MMQSAKNFLLGPEINKLAPRTGLPECSDSVDFLTAHKEVFLTRFHQSPVSFRMKCSAIRR